MQKLQVGKPYSETRSSWPEGAELRIENGTIEFRMFIEDISQAERDAVKHGRAEFGVYATQKGDIFFMYRFGDAFPWSDAPFCILLQDEGNREPLPDLPTEESRYAVLVTLVEAKTGILKVIREVTMSPAASRMLKDAVDYQLSDAYRSGWTPKAYGQRTDAVYELYDSDRLAAMAKK